VEEPGYENRNKCMILTLGRNHSDPGTDDFRSHTIVSSLYATSSTPSPQPLIGFKFIENAHCCFSCFGKIQDWQ
jgi:hypothetical protein